MMFFSNTAVSHMNSHHTHTVLMTQISCCAFKMHIEDTEHLIHNKTSRCFLWIPTFRTDFTFMCHFTETYTNLTFGPKFSGTQTLAWDAHLKSTRTVAASGCSFTQLTHMHRNLWAASMHRGRESASCAHTLNATSERRNAHVRLRGCRPPSLLSPMPDMLIPTVAAGRRGKDRLEVSVSRCAHAVMQSEKGWRSSSCCFGGIWEEGANCRVDFREDCPSTSATYLL